MKKIHNIWSTKIGEYYADEEIKTAAMQLYANPAPVLENIPGYEYNMFSNTTNDNAFVNWVLNSCADYCSDINSAKEFEITRGWAISLLYGNYNDFHTHGYSHLAVVYYIQANKTIHPDLEIIDPRPPHILSRIHRHSNTTFNDNHISSGHITYKVSAEEGKLVIMPGYLAHGVMTNMSEIPRVCIAMNINISK